MKSYIDRRITDLIKRNQEIHKIIGESLILLAKGEITKAERLLYDRAEPHYKKSFDLARGK